MTFFSSIWSGLPTFVYEAEKIEPAKHSAWYLTLTVSEFDVEKGGQFQIVWIEDRTPEAGSTSPETREVVTILGKAEKSGDGIGLVPSTVTSHLKATVARMGPFASIGLPWKQRAIVWKDSQGPLPTFSVLTKVEDIIAGATQIHLDFTPISQKDAEGQTTPLLQQRETEKLRCILEGSKESVKNEFKGEKIDGGLESYMTLSFFDLDKNTGRGQFTADWVEDYTPSFGKTTREVVEIKGTVDATAEGIKLSPYTIFSKSKITLARLASVASLSMPFSTTEVLWTTPKGYKYDGNVPQFSIPIKMEDIAEGRITEIDFDYVRLCQDTGASKIVSKEKQVWKLTTTALISTLNTYLSTLETNWNEVPQDATTTTTTTTTTTEPATETAGEAEVPAQEPQQEATDPAGEVETQPDGY